MREKQRIVILGAAGFIGYHLSRHFAESETCSLLLVDNFIRYSPDQFFQDLISKENIEFRELDLTKIENFEKLFCADDVVINCVALNGTNNFYVNPVSVIHNTAISSILSAEAAAHSKIQLYIYLGSSESYSGGFDFGLVPIPTPEDTPFVIPNLENPRWGYGASKSLGELSTYANHLQLDLNFIILRIHNIYGPRMGNMHVIPDLIQKFLKNENKLHGLNETRSFMYIDDFVNIVSKILENPSKFINTVYNIGSDKEIMISQLALMIKNLLNKDLVFQDVGRLPGSVARRCPDISLIRSKIEYSETSLSSGLEKTINWYLSNS